MSQHSTLEPESSKHVLGAFFEVYNTLGFGFLERVYADALEIELLERGRSVQREVMLPIWYKARKVSSQRVDMLVDGKILLELKSTSVLAVESERILRSYLCASTITVGFLLHFGPKPRFLRRVHTTKSF